MNLNYKFISIFFLFNLNTIYGFLDIPENVNFDITYYNDSNCSIPQKTSEFTFFCTNSSKINGTPGCCYSYVNSVSYIDNHQFEKCYPYMNNKFVDYSCQKTTYFDFNVMEIFAILGLIGMLLFLITFFVYIGKSLFSSKRENYHRIN